MTLTDAGETGDAGSSRETPPPPRRRVVLVAALAVLVALVAVPLGLAVLSSDDEAPSDDPAAGGEDGQPGGGAVPDVAVIGDSLVEQSRDQFAAHAADAGLTVEAMAFGGSAPCDWRDEFERFAAAGVETMIVSFAGNDNTRCVNPAGGGPRDPETIADAYRAMVPELLEPYAGTGTDVYLVTPPPVGPPASEPAAAAIRRAYRDIADGRAHVTLVDPGPSLSPDGAFHASLPCEPWDAARCSAEGTVTVREDDGIHLTAAGGERYARALLAAIGHPVDG